MKSSSRSSADPVRRLTVLIAVTAFLYALANGLGNTLVNDIIESFSIDGARQGLIMSTISVGIIAAVIVGPLFQGRVNKLVMITASAGLIGAALIVQGLSASAGMFFAVSVVVGIGFGLLDGYINSLMIDIHPGDSAKPMGLLHGSFGVGSLLLPLGAAALLGVMLWRGVYVLAGVLMLLLCATLALFFRRDLRAGDSAPAEKKLTAADIRSFMRDRRSLLLLLFGFAAGCVQTGTTCWVVRYMTLEFRTEALGVTCLSCYWIFSTVNRFLIPRLKTRPMKLLIAGCLMNFVLLAGGVALHTPKVMLIAVCLSGLCSGHFIPMMFIEAAEGYRGSTTLTTFLMSITCTFGRIVIPLGMAAWSDTLGCRGSMLLPGAAALLGLMSCMLALRQEKGPSVIHR